jgi:hypothetical protein
MTDVPANKSNPTGDPRTQAPTPAAPPAQSPPAPKGSRRTPAADRGHEQGNG